MGLVSLLEEDRRLIVEADNKDCVSRDVVYVLNEMITEAREYRTERLKALFIAYKYAISNVKRVKNHVDEVEELLADHGII